MCPLGSEHNSVEYLSVQFTFEKLQKTPKMTGVEINLGSELGSTRFIFLQWIQLFPINAQVQLKIAGNSTLCILGVVSPKTETVQKNDQNGQNLFCLPTKQRKKRKEQCLHVQILAIHVIAQNVNSKHKLIHHFTNNLLFAV